LSTPSQHHSKESMSLRNSLICITASLLFLFQFLFSKCAFGLTPEKKSFLATLHDVPPGWMEQQIQKDFAPFKQGISQTMIENIYPPLNPSERLLIRFKIINNQLLSFDQSHDWTGRSNIIRNALNFLIDAVGLPNLDMVITMHDGIVDFPKETKGPILTFAKIKNMQCGILIPDMEALDGYDNNSSLRKEALESVPWENKEQKVFWRGSTTGGFFTKDNWSSFPRSKLTLLSLQRPELVDAKFTNIVQCEPEVPSILSERQLVSSHVSVNDHLKYRYLVDVDGNSCTYSRCYWILLSNSLLFKSGSDHVQWYYKGLRPYQHYVPLEHDMADIFEKIEWAKKHDEEVKQIAAQATTFAVHSLSIENIYLYFYKVLLEYARLATEPFCKNIMRNKPEKGELGPNQFVVPLFTIIPLLQGNHTCPSRPQAFYFKLFNRICPPGAA